MLEPSEGKLVGTLRVACCRQTTSSGPGYLTDEIENDEALVKSGASPFFGLTSSRRGYLTGYRSCNSTVIMRRPFLYLLVIAVSIVAGVGVGFYAGIKQPVHRTWIDYSAPDRSFYAAFPEQPALLIGPAPKAMSGDVHTVSARTSIGTYQIDYFDASQCPTDDSIRSVTANQIGGRLVIVSPVSFRLEGQAATVECKLVRTPSRLFRVSVSHPNWLRDRSEMEYFFSRFTPAIGDASE
ncbi:MAG: hypothetical protein ACREDR_43450 [Blastocatellia bacterium]